MPELFGSDCYSPKEIAEKVENVGVTKASLPLLPMIALGVLAGGFIGLGALYFTLVASDPSLPFAVTRVLGGVAFSLGLILVVVAGAELFTGNNLLVMACVAGRISTPTMLKNFVVIFVANFIGAAGLAALVALSGHAKMGGGIVGKERSGSVALVLGSEAHGLPDDVTAALDTIVRIPMAGAIESLNVAVAASVLMFEAARQSRD